MEKTIGKYKILREIGKGGMATVYKGLDPQTQKSVAIKVLNAALVDRSMVTRFTREAQAMARLRHPNITEIYEIAITGGNHFIAMEYIEGDNVKSLLKAKGRFSVEETLSIIAPVASALDYAHNELMIHRDIKPNNIMITTEGTVKVVDFGLVQIAGQTRVTAAGAAVGTPEYMSPEQISGQAIDSRTDIYSLGVTMYEMLAGTPPFLADTVQGVMMKHKYEAAPLLRSKNPKIPAELERIVHKAIAKDVSQRYQRISELIEDIRGMGGGLMPEIPKATSTIVAKSPQPTKSKKTRPRLMRKVVIVLALGIVAVGGYVYRAEFLYFIDDMIDTVQSKFFTESQESSEEVNLVAETERRVRQLEKAERYYEEGLRYYEHEEWDKAIRSLQAAIRLRPNYAQYYSDLATVYERAGRISKAINTWQALVENNPASAYADDARKRLARLRSIR